MCIQIPANRPSANTLPWKVLETCSNVADRIANISRPIFETLSWAASSLCSLTTTAINASISISKLVPSKPCIISLLVMGSASGSSTPIAPANISDHLINTYTNGEQRDPSTTAFSDGSFIVIWRGEGLGDTSGIFGQRFFANGSAWGSGFRANTYTNGAQTYPSTATFPDDSFIVTWYGEGVGDTVGIFGQRFFANGSVWGEEFRANSYTDGSQFTPSTATFLDGSFIVTWYGEGVGDIVGIFGQRFFANGSALGEEFRANTHTNGFQRFPSTAAFSDGSFFVTWEGEGIGDSSGIFGQRFFANGSALGEEFRVNTYTNGGQYEPNTAAFSDNSFVVTWHGEGIGDTVGIFGQRFFANRSAWGEEFRANTYTIGSQAFPSTTTFPNGSFVVTWRGEGVGDSPYGIFGQRFFANCSALGEEFRANTHTNGEQRDPSTVAFSDDSLVVTWRGEETPGSVYNIYGKRFDMFGQPTVWERISFSPSASSMQITTSNLNTLTSTSTQLSSPSPSLQSTRKSSSSTFPSNLLSSFPNSPKGSSGNPTSVASSVKISSAASLSSQGGETAATNQGGIPLITTFTYEESYPIIVDGETIGTFTFTGGTGQLDSNNDNTLNIQLDPNLTLENGVAIILFTVPAGEELLWEDIVLAYDTESQCYHAEGVFTTSEEEHAYQLVFEYDSTGCSLYTTALKFSTLPAFVNGLS